MTTPRWQRVWSQTATWRCCSGEAHSSRREMNLNVGLVSVSPNIVATGAAGRTCTCPPAQMPAETCRGRRSCRRCLIVPGDFPSGSDELKIIAFHFTFRVTSPYRQTPFFLLGNGISLILVTFSLFLLSKVVIC